MKKDFKWVLIDLVVYIVLIVHILYIFFNNYPKHRIYYAIIFTLVLIYKDVAKYRKDKKNKQIEDI